MWDVSHVVSKRRGLSVSDREGHHTSTVEHSNHKTTWLLYKAGSTISTNWLNIPARARAPLDRKARLARGRRCRARSGGSCASPPAAFPSPQRGSSSGRGCLQRSRGKRGKEAGSSFEPLQAGAGALGEAVCQPPARHRLDPELDVPGLVARECCVASERGS